MLACQGQEEGIRQNSINTYVHGLCVRCQLRGEENFPQADWATGRPRGESEQGLRRGQPNSNDTLHQRRGRGGQNEASEQRTETRCELKIKTLPDGNVWTQAWQEAEIRSGRETLTQIERRVKEEGGRN